MFEKFRDKFKPELSPEDKYLSLSEEAREGFSDTAMKLFVKSNMNAPTCVVAQGALIAMYSQEIGFKELELAGTCLAHDVERLDHIAQKANNIHKVREKGPKREVTLHDVVDFVHDDFMVAESLMDHTPEELNYIATTMYKGYLSKLTNRGGRVSIDENAYYQRALSIHADH